MAIIENVVAGDTRLTEIAKMSGLDTSSESQYPATLQQLDIVVRDVPATISRPGQSKQGRCRIANSYHRYYYRFLAPRRTQLEQGDTHQVWATIRQHLQEFVGTFGFEELCRERVFGPGDAGKLPFVPCRVGGYWTQLWPRMDVVSVNEDDHAILLGECKWTGEPIGDSVVQALIEKTAEVVHGPRERWKAHYAFFSKAGFTEEARRAAGQAKCFWISLDHLDRDLHDV